VSKGATQYDPRSSQPMTAIVRVAVVVVTIALFVSSLFNALQGLREISILLALATPLGLSAWGFARAGHNEAAIGLLCCVLITVVTLILVLNPLGVHDMAVTAYGGIVLVGALLLSRRAYYAIVAFMFFAATAAFAADLFGFSRSQISSITAWPQYVDFLVITGVFVLLGRTAAEELFGSLGDAHYASSTDTTSGLLNRPGFLMTAAMRLRALQGEGGFATLVVLDIDAFRRINLVIGHEAADRLLAETGRRLKLVCDENASVIGRIGDDEFAVLGVGIGEELAEAFARDLHESMNFEHLGVSMHSAAGFARFPRDAHGIEALMHAAQSGVAAAKASPTNRISGPADRI
jgi:diguanylate cyclase (GGDEF)-like protein